MVSNLKNKIVFITGASSGIGKACAEQFAQQGANLILTARRLERIENLAGELQNNYSVNVLPIKMDVQNKEEVSRVISQLPSDYSKIDVLLNNAGLALSSVKFQQGNLDEWDTMINTNLKGLLYVTREILPGMVERNQGHIINISSTAGISHYATGNIYSATKHAVRAISKSLRLDLLGFAIRVTDIAPGLTETEFSEVRWQDKERAKKFYQGFTPLSAGDIAETVIFAANRPPHVNIGELVVYPTAQADVGTVYREGEQVNKGLMER